MKLSDLVGRTAVDARFAARRDQRRHGRQPQGEAGHLFVAVPGAKADGAHFVAAGARGGRGGGRWPRRARRLPSRRRLRAGRRMCAARSRSRRRVLSAPAGDHRRRHRHQRQDLGRRLHAADLGARASGGEHRHDRRRRAASAKIYGSLTTPDPVDAASHARPTGGRGRHASRAGSVLPRPRPAPARRRAPRRPAPSPISPRPHGLSSDASRTISPPSCGCSRHAAQGRRGGDRSPITSMPSA